MLYRSHPECEQFYSVLSSQAIECNIVHKQNDAACNVKICTFNDLDNKLVQTDDFDLVIVFNPLRLQVYDVNISEHRKQHPTKFLGFFSNQETENNWFYNAPCIFSYSYTDVVRDGYDSVIPESDIEKSVYFQILLKIGFKQSFEQQEILGKYNIRPNIVLEKNGQYFLTDIKCYRGFEYSSDNLNHAVKQMLYYKSLTEKYLYPAVLRNVAFIISRNGFHPHAEIAAMGCLKENGKLIVSLDDADLCKMLLIKKNGEEPSDYLLNKVESILMSVSK